VTARSLPARRTFASSPPSTTTKAIGRSQRRLRATSRPDHRLRRWPLDDSAGLHGPNQHRAKDLSRGRPASANRRWRDSPPLQPARAPLFPSSVLRAKGWIRPFALNEPTKALVPTPPREGRCFPESQGAFHRQESVVTRITPKTGTDTSMTPPHRFRDCRHCKRRHQRLFIQPDVPNP